MAAHIPELGYAIVSMDSVLEMNVMGVKKIGNNDPAAITDKFRIGSNTKTITSLIAAQLVKERKLSWNTKFFDLFPEFKNTSQSAFLHVTLHDLLSFRTRLFPYTYTDSLPVKGQFSGSEQEQRYQFAKWFFTQPPVGGRASFYFSNLNYVAAGLMMEKASGKSYKELVGELGNQLQIQFYFSQPNMLDDNEPWGHNANSVPEPPGDPYKLNWLLPAGNITMSLPDIGRYAIEHLKGLHGKSVLLDSSEFNDLHYGAPGFALGWFWRKEKGDLLSYHEGNPGTFLCRMYLLKKQRKAFIVVCNIQSDAAEEGLEEILQKMRKAYRQ